MDNRESFIDKVNAQLAVWDADIDRLEARMRQERVANQQAANAEIAILRQHREDAQRQLVQAQQANDSAWDELKMGAEEAWAKIKLAFTQTRERVDQQKAA